MAEIKRGFLQGKMNKDLDAKLIPNGQYRDAMNIQVTTSDDSDVGTAQNVSGNHRMDTLELGRWFGYCEEASDYEGEPRNFTESECDKAGLVWIHAPLSDFECVGSIDDEKNNKLYWFVTSNHADIIAEYHVKDDGTDETNLVLVDRRKDVLKFKKGRIITGINIIDNLLFWTDGVNEPRKINIDRCKLGTRFDATHTRLHNPRTHHIVTGICSDPQYTTPNDCSSNSEVWNPYHTLSSSNIDIKEEHITVIKKRPTTPPTIKILSSIRDGIVTGTTKPSSFYISNTLLERGDNIDLRINQTGTYDVVTLEHDMSEMNWEVGDVLLVKEPSAPGSLPEAHQVRLEIISINPTEPDDPAAPTTTTYSQLITCEILTLADSVTDANTELDIELEGPKKIPDPQTVPPTIEQEQFFKNQLREFIKPQSNINTSINNQSVTYVAPVSPSVKHLTQQGIGG